jgi:hypothetical protein
VTEIEKSGIDHPKDKYDGAKAAVEFALAIAAERKLWPNEWGGGGIQRST